MSAILGESLLFPQMNGPQIRLRVFGDEFYSYLEDERWLFRRVRPGDWTVRLCQTASEAN